MSQEGPSADEFYTSVDGTQRLKTTELIEAFGFYLHEHRGMETFSTRQISACFAECHLTVPSWIASHLSKNCSGRHAKFLKAKDGYKLSRATRASVKQQIAATSPNETAIPPDGLVSGTEAVVPMSVVDNTRGYIEKVANQANGTYENGWHDACAVMIRRLLKTLIIEAFEHHQIADNIKNRAGEFYYLRDLITTCLNEPKWNLTRNCKRAMPKLKDVGDKSAHSRRYNAHKSDIEPLLLDIRLVVQELIYLAKLK